jgi:hypothetical protein
MPMRISWTNPMTGNTEQIFDQFHMDSKAGRSIIGAVRVALARKFDLDPEFVPGFHVESVSWDSLRARHRVREEALV